MSGKRGNFFVLMKSDGSRQYKYFEHDDRGSNRSGGNYDGGGRSNYQHRNAHRGGGKYRGPGGRGGRNNRDSGWDEDRSGRYPEGHWRGGRRGGRSQRGPQYKDNDVEMGSSNVNRRQDMYKNQGRHKADNRNNRMNNNLKNKLGWHKILIRDAASFNKHEVLEAIKNLVNENFIPVMCEVEAKSLVFYLEDNGPAAQAITEISRRICMPNGQRLIIHSNRSPPPNRPLTPAQREVVTRIMSERYSVELKRLDLKNFHNDSKLVNEGIFCPLYRQPNMQIIIDIVVTNIPQVVEIDLSFNKINSLDQLDRLAAACPALTRLSLKKNKIVNESTLDKLTGLGITELILEGNMVCDRFRDPDTYISAIRKRCPKVTYLDGQELPKPIGFEVDDEVSTLPATIPCFYVQDQARELITIFIQQYYQIFDTENRQPLAAAYSEYAVFTLSCNFPETGPAARFTNLYMSENRNLRRVSNSERREKLVVQGRAAIALAISRLPNTTHDVSSFTIDVPVAEAQLMVAVVSGVYRQLADRTPPVRFFSRTLTIVPEGSGLCIANEQLYITTATVDQIKRAFKDPPTASPAVAPITSVPVEIAAPASVPTEAIKQEMMIKFSAASGMLPQYSQMCLEQNGWDFQKSAEMFSQLKAENKIPPEYFPQSPQP